MGDVFVKDPSLGVDCSTSAVKGTVSTYGPATFKYTIVNDSDEEVFVSMVATLTVATDPPASMTNQDLNRFLAPHTSFTKPEFTLFGNRVFDDSGLVTVTASITFSLFPSGVVIFTDQTECQLSVVDPVDGGASAPSFKAAPGARIQGTAGLQITRPASLPDGFTTQSSFDLNSNSPSPQSTAFLDGDVLLFQFSGFNDDVDIQVDLTDDQGNGSIASTTITVAASSPDQFLQFQGFPPRPDGSAMDSCLFQITLTNDSSPGEGTEIGVVVFRQT